MKLLSLALSALLFSASAMGSPVVTVLGVPLGKKLVPQPKKCSSAAARPEEVKEICWVYQQRSATGKSGMVLLPGADTRPKWAAYSMFNMTLNAAGEAETLTVKTHTASVAPDIVQSISSRFGPPMTTRARVVNASWSRSDVGIEMSCSPEWCSVEFKSAAQHAAAQDEIAKRKKIDNARPIAP